MYCGECKKECNAHTEDQGIGPLEVWGRKIVDTDIVLVSDCCDAQVFEDEDLEDLADAGQYMYDEECERADFEYERRKEERYDRNFTW